MRYRFLIVMALCVFGSFGCADAPVDPPIDLCANVSCNAGEVCREGKCESSCTKEQTQCGKSCVDIQSDDQHCGACDTVCKAGEACNVGKCTTSCPKDTTACGDACIDTQSSAAHCGQCGAACDEGAACVAGACKTTCATGQSACGTACVDTQADVAHCGACDAKCNVGEVCSAGRCVLECTTGQSLCGDACVEHQSNAAHCGKCNNMCQSSETCKAGVCTPKCPSGQTSCNDTCVDAQSSQQHCGTCGNTCPTGKRCLVGKCEPGWAIRGGSVTSQSTERVRAMIVDKSGNIYVAGSFQKRMNFGNFMLESDGDQGMFVAKLDAQWQPIWAKGSSLQGNERINLALDQSGHLYIGGSFYNARAAFGTIEVNNPPITASNGSKRYTSRMFVSKMQASDGKWLWAVAGGANAQTTTDGLDVNSQGHVYVTGTFVTDTGSPKATFGKVDLVSSGAEIFIASLDKDGKWLWAKSEGSSSNDYARGLKIDGSDNIYVIGYFLKAMTLGSITLTPQSGYDGFIAKMDKTHTWLWARSFRGSDTVQDLDVDAAGNAYVIGNFSGAVELDAFRITRKGATDIFAAKLNSAGKGQWLVGGGGSGSDTATSIRADSSGNAYILGRFFTSSAATNFAEFGTFKLKASPNANDWHIVVAKISTTGAYTWATAAGGVRNEYPQAAAVNATGSMLVAGYFQESMTLGSTTLKSKGGDDMFFATLDTTGAFKTALAQGGEGGGDDTINDVTSDKDGNVYVVGTFYEELKLGSITLSPPANAGTNAGEAAFVGKLDRSGKWLWAQRFADTDGNRVEPLSVAVDQAGNVAITGNASGPKIQFGNIPYKSRDSTEDLFVAKLDKDGKWLWAKGGGGANEDASGHAVSFDSLGNIYVAGQSKAGIIERVTFKSVGGGNAILAKFSAAGKCLWITAGGSHASDFLSGVTVNEQGESFVSGRVYADKKPIVFGTLSVPTKHRSEKVLAAKLDKDGKWIWASIGEGETKLEAAGIVANKAGTLFLAGYFVGTVTLGTFSLKAKSNGREGFVAAIDGTGKWLWARALQSPQQNVVNAISLDSSGNVLVTGYFQDDITLDSVTIPGEVGQNLVFVLAMDDKGKALWGKRTSLSPKGYGGGGYFEGKGLAAGLNGTAIVGGHFGARALFGDTDLPTSGASDLFVWMIVP